MDHSERYLMLPRLALYELLVCWLLQLLSKHLSSLPAATNSNMTSGNAGRRYKPRPEASYPSRPLPAPQMQDHSSKSLHPRAEVLLPKMMNTDMDAVDAENQVELEEKTQLINQVLELQHTLEDLSARVDAVKEENLKLKLENQVLGQYIENLMSASSVFQTTDTKSKRK
ncbi:short coiled-coil protein-like [Acomys russatus]|uniref:short coiled-coil protein-like n=1 Tax=Acomys russatus TaxID=60746 RepID=UPI0021E1EC8B|nr:short coiled-coil protein-like [Acomys russatus]